MTGLTLGTSYEFTVEAQNAQGYSDPSSLVQFLHALPPSQPSAPSVSIANSEVTVSMTYPTDNGDTVSSYTIYFRHSDGTSFSEETTNCNGTSSTIVSARTCTVPLSVLEASPFSLSSGDTVYVKFSATNSKGTSPVSPVGNS